MKRIAQIVAATGFVRAVVETSGDVVAPKGMVFIELGPDIPSPGGMYWNGDGFQVDAP